MAEIKTVAIGPDTHYKILMVKGELERKVRRCFSMGEVVDYVIKYYEQNEIGDRNEKKGTN